MAYMMCQQKNKQKKKNSNSKKRLMPSAGQKIVNVSPFLRFPLNLSHWKHLRLSITSALTGRNYKKWCMPIISNRLRVLSQIEYTSIYSKTFGSLAFLSGKAKGFPPLLAPFLEKGTLEIIPYNPPSLPGLGQIFPSASLHSLCLSVVFLSYPWKASESWVLGRRNALLVNWKGNNTHVLSWLYSL